MASKKIELSRDEQIDLYIQSCDKKQLAEMLYEANKAVDLYKPRGIKLANNDNEMTIHDYQDVLADHRKLVRELDVIINGKNAAEQASLIDMVAQIKHIFNQANEAPEGMPPAEAIEKELLALFGFGYEDEETFIDVKNQLAIFDFMDWFRNYQNVLLFKKINCIYPGNNEQYPELKANGIKARLIELTTTHESTWVVKVGNNSDVAHINHPGVAQLFIDAYNIYQQTGITLPALSEKLIALDKFKQYVHQRLDDAGVKKNPHGQHSQHGCRIGDRLDIVLTQQGWVKRAAELLHRVASMLDPELVLTGPQIKKEINNLLKDLNEL